MDPVVTTVTPTQVAARCGLKVGATGGTAEEVAAEATLLTELALADLNEALEHRFREMPQPVVDECVLTIAKAWKDRRRVTGDGAQTSSPTDAQKRNVPRDTRAGVSTILGRYTVGLA